jgi:beta-glucosidase
MILAATAALLAHAAAPAPAPWRNTSLPIAERVANLVSLLTLEEKVANLYANAAPGAPRLGLGPYRYDEECMRGAVTSGVSKRPLGTGVPTLLALAGTFNVSLLAAVGALGAREVRAYYNIDRRTAGLTTTANCYAPVVNLVRDPRWGRAAEMAIGEDPTLGRVYARAWTAAMRGGAPGETARLVSSVCKHVGVYGGPEDVGGSRFSFTAALDERSWREDFLPAFRGSAEAGADAFMCSYSAVTLTDAPGRLARTPDCASPYLLNTVLRGEWGWSGFVTSDANAVDNVHSTHGFANSTEGAAVAALAGGCDLELTCCGGAPAFPTLAAAVRGGRLPAAAVDAAVARVLRGRFAVGDLDPPAASPWAALNESDIYAPASLALAREAARQSVVLLANAPAAASRLPWQRAALAGKTLCVAGPLANATHDFMGGYTSVPAPGGIVSPLAAFTAALAGGAVELVPGCAPGDSTACAALQPALAAALARCNAVVAVLGTSAYAPAGANGAPNAAHEGEGKDRTTVALAGQQGALLAALRAAGVPLAVVIASGGMVDVGDAGAGDMGALLAAPFGGQYAGDAIAAVVLGDVNPAARLTTTWYTRAAFAALGDLSNYSMAGRTYRYAAPDAARFVFGHGLSYSNFTYAALTVSPAAPRPCDTVTVTATLTNAAGPAGAEVAQLYVRFAGASVPQPPAHSLVNWERVVLGAGGAATLTLTVTPEDNAVLRAGDFVPVIEPGVRALWLGASSDAARAPGLAGGYTIVGDATPLAACGGGGGSGAPPPGVAHVWPRPVLAPGTGAARWAA